MADDEVQVFILFTYLIGKTSGDGALIQSVPDADAVHERRSADASIIVQFVNHTRIGNETTATGNVFRYFIRDDATQIAGVFVNGRPRIIEHLLVDFIYTARNRLCQSTASYDGSKIERHIHALEFVDDNLLAKLELVGYFFKFAQFFRRVLNASEQHGLCVVVNGYLG